MEREDLRQLLQDVGMMLLAMDNAEGLRRGLVQPERKPSHLTERVFAALKSMKDGCCGGVCRCHKKGISDG
jgi:hypothetical protein